MSTNPTYASRKRRKPIQKSVKTPAEGVKSNPSKRHRERLNGELERLASLLPFPQDVVSKLDKLTVLRLSVSYLRAKSFFSVTLKSNNCPEPDGNGLKQPGKDFLEGELLLQVLNGFVLVVTAEGVVFYASSTIQDYLGFHQSDVIHQSVYDLVHTEDRPEFQRQLHWALKPTLSPEAGQESPDEKNAVLPLTYDRPELLPPENSTFLERNFVCRLRCLLDNSSGFLAMNFQGHLKLLHGQNQKTKDELPVPPQLALFAVASPLQPPSILEIRTKNFIFRTKHKLDFTPMACDARGKVVLGYTEAELCYGGTGYQFIHAADMLYCAENHIRMIKTGESGLTVFRLLTKQSGWVWVQANARLIYKNARPECIIASQRVLTEEEGEENLRKRNLKLPFNFTTGEAVLYDVNGLSMEGDTGQGKSTRSLDPNSILGAMLKQDESVYVCVPAQNRSSFQHGALADDGEDMDQIFSDDWQDSILSLSENGIFKSESRDCSNEDKDLLSFMKSLGICREDLELIQKDEQFLKVSLDEQGDIMDVADEILTYVQESLMKTSDCIFSSTSERKPSGQDSSCAPQQQQPHTLPHLHRGQPLLLPQQQQPFPQQRPHTQTHPQQPIPQQHLNTHAQQPIPQQHLNTHAQQPIPQQHLHTQAHPWQPVPQQHALTQGPFPQQQQFTGQHPIIQTHPQQTVPQQNVHAQTHPHQPIPQQQPCSQPHPQLLSLLPLQQERSLLLQKQPSQSLISHAQQQLPLKHHPQPGRPLPHSSLPEQQQQQLCHKLKHLQVNGTCPSLTQPVTVQTLLCRDQNLQQYGQPFLEGSALELPYRNQLNTLSIACNEGFSQYRPSEGLPAGEADDFIPQDLEELLESLQPEGPGEQQCVSLLQGGSSVPLCHPRALPMHQRLPVTSGLGHVQQVNPKLFTPGTLGHQPFLANFQDSSSGDLSQTPHESTGDVDLPQPGHPLDQHPAESRPFQDLTMGGFL
ncbi:hypothetical protein AAFF_G00404300 [Aldrovandia affinis]|uniref:Aryl hydrocarbon receptor n=1 Tax=Aldrovandia affinis TaxID=143900 RepID=A0AAD7X0N0_9TELE|nr:hypothetical protein AAFF_G00404300 [Aldrovandia affinis]